MNYHIYVYEEISLTYYCQGLLVLALFVWEAVLLNLSYQVCVLVFAKQVIYTIYTSYKLLSLSVQDYCLYR